MRIVHISDTAFFGLPNGACLHVAHNYDSNITITVPGFSAQTVSFGFVNAQGDVNARMKAHVQAEIARFTLWLASWLIESGVAGSQFKFERVLDMGAPVVDEPFRIREATTGGPA